MITPQVGKPVWFYPSRTDLDDNVQPMAAIVAAVHDDRSVNLAIFDQEGRTGHISGSLVPLLQDDDKPPAEGAFATFMKESK